MNLPDNCRDCDNKMCQLTVPRFHYKHAGKTSITSVDGVPAQNALLWDFFEFALKHCFQVQDFRVMLFYGLVEHDIDHFMRETDELEAETVIRFLNRTNQVILKLMDDFSEFKKSFGRQTQITDLIPNMVTIIQMELVTMVQLYLRHHADDPNFDYTMNDIL